MGAGEKRGVLGKLVLEAFEHTAVFEERVDSCSRELVTDLDRRGGGTEEKVAKPHKRCVGFKDIPKRVLIVECVRVEQAKQVVEVFVFGVNRGRGEKDAVGCCCRGKLAKLRRAVFAIAHVMSLINDHEIQRRRIGGEFAQEVGHSNARAFVGGFFLPA